MDGPKRRLFGFRLTKAHWPVILNGLKNQADHSYIYAAYQSAIDSLVTEIRHVDRVAIDIEADSFHHYFQKVCLIQLSFDGKHYIVDPLAEEDLTVFMEVLAHKRLIIHDAGYDLRMMLSSFDFSPKVPIFDTMIAAQLLGYEKFSLSALTERFCDIVLSKRNQRADWSRRPLPDSLLKYASDDTRFLTGIAEKMADELAALGRTKWHEEWCCRAVTSSSIAPPPADPDKVWRIKGISALSQEQLNFIREICCWRDARAQKTDLPAFKVMPNHTILELAHWAQRNPKGEIEKTGPKLPRNCTGRRLRSLEKTIIKAREISPSDWPSHRKARSHRKHSPDCSGIYEDISKECKHLAEELGIKPSVIAPRATVETIARNKPTTIKEMIECTQMMNWQANLLGKKIKPIMQEFKK